jgi:ABC-2 type transport system ATP-binding protein
MSECPLEARDLSKRYGRRPVFSHVSLSLESGRVAGVVGENGSGKSTLLKCLLGIEAVHQGTIRMTGRPGYCPQENYLNPRYTVGEHVRLVTAIYSAQKKSESGFTDLLMDAFHLVPCLNDRIGTLSGGTYQKVKFVTAAMHRPSILLLDEPYDGLDWRMYQVFWEVIDLLRHGGTAVLLVTHFVLDNERFDLIYTMEGGGLVKGGS